MLRMQEMIFWGSTPQTPPPPIHAWYIGHKRGLQPLLSPSNILSHRKIPFQKIPPPHGKILKKGPVIYSCFTSKGCHNSLFIQEESSGGSSTSDDRNRLLWQPFEIKQLYIIYLYIKCNQFSLGVFR